MYSIPFNKPYLTGSETNYILEALNSGKISGDGMFTKKCHAFFEQHFQFQKCLLTTSCTDALELAALLVNIKPGDEVIVPSFTFVSTANAFVLRGAKIVFADSRSDQPNIDEDTIEQLITDKTKAIVPVHYAGVACNMDKINQIADKYNLTVIEDAAQALDGYYTSIDGKKRALGGLGNLSTFSFHETKNIMAGEGGMIVINDKSYIERAEILREKGTDRSKFFRGEVDKYGWVDVGSSFLPSDIIAGFLYAQLENIEKIQSRRKQIWKFYFDALGELESNGFLKLPVIPTYASNNAHMFYLICRTEVERDDLIRYLNSFKINAVFHYLSLHKSAYYHSNHDGRTLPHSDQYSGCLVRLPLFYELTEEMQLYIVEHIYKFYNKS